MNSYIDVANLLLFLQCGRYEYIEDILKFINDNTIQAITISDNATNGDILKIVFPNIEWEEIHDLKGDKNIGCTNKFWNAPYKRGGENEGKNETSNN